MRGPIVTVALVLLAVGCGGGGTRTVEVVARYSRFQPETVTVPVGQPITFTLRNEDPIDHEWIVGDETLHARHRDGTEPSHAGQRTEQSIPALDEVQTTITFDTPGTYMFVCHLPKHEDYGMKGTLVVTGG